MCFRDDETAQIHPYFLTYSATAAAKSLQSCPTLCDPIDGSPPGSPVPGILQAITLEWVAISFSNAWKWKVKVKSLSRDRLLATPWTTAYQAPPSMGFSRQEYWSGVPLPSRLLILLMINNSIYLCYLEYRINHCNVKWIEPRTSLKQLHDRKWGGQKETNQMRRSQRTDHSSKRKKVAKPREHHFV